MKITSILLTVFLLSCGNASNKYDDPLIGSSADSLNGQTENELRADVADRMEKSHALKKVEASKLSPVVIDSAYFITPNTKLLWIRIKNNSGKDVDAIRFGYSVYDNFEDNVSNSPLGYELTSWQFLLKANESEKDMITLTNVASSVKNTFVDRVHFTDSTIWEAKQ